MWYLSTCNIVLSSSYQALSHSISHNPVVQTSNRSSFHEQSARNDLCTPERIRCRDCSQVAFHHHSSRTNYRSHAHIINWNMQVSWKWEIRCCRSPHSRETPERKGVHWVRGEHKALQDAPLFPEQDAPKHLTKERVFVKRGRSHSYQTALWNPKDLLPKWFNSIKIIQ